MTPMHLRGSVVAERVAWVRRMLHSIEKLPTDTFENFMADNRNAASAESYLRRGIEALLDLGRHVLAKGFAVATTEYKEIGLRLSEVQVISKDTAVILQRIAGYRNRMVHFYHEISNEEIYNLCTTNIKDIETILQAILDWLQENPDKVDQTI